MQTMLKTLRDDHDERWARLMRDEFGRRKWLLSWHRDEVADAWLARLSCPQLPETVERHGRSRCHAIGRANRALSAMLQLAAGPDRRAVTDPRDRD